MARKEDITPSEKGRPDRATLAERIREKALALGFDGMGIAAADAPAEDQRRLTRFLNQKRHGEMAWMAARARERADPRQLWPAVRSIIVVGSNYNPGGDPLSLLARPERGAISVYARSSDYHDILKKRLKALGRWLADEHQCAVKIFTDTAPVMEKPVATRAALGWQGKHTNLVSQRFGSWLFLGEVFTDLPLPAATAESDHCGSCRACLDICPTDAFPAPYQLDARRCISYLTIEHKSHIPAELRPLMGNRIYGCDDCLAVCPWNKFAVRTRDYAFLPRAELTAPRLADLAALDEAGFRQLFAGSPLKRTGRNRFLRNVLIALGNSGDPKSQAALLPHLTDPSPLVRAAAVWALSRLLPEKDITDLAGRHLAAESDPAVRQEWRDALSIASDGEKARPPASSSKPR